MTHPCLGKFKLWTISVPVCLWLCLHELMCVCVRVCVCERGCFVRPVWYSCVLSSTCIRNALGGGGRLKTAETETHLQPYVVYVHSQHLIRLELCKHFTVRSLRPVDIRGERMETREACSNKHKQPDKETDGSINSHADRHKERYSPQALVLSAGFAGIAPFSTHSTQMWPY